MYVTASKSKQTELELWKKYAQDLERIIGREIEYQRNHAPQRADRLQEDMKEAEENREPEEQQAYPYHFI